MKTAIYVRVSTTEQTTENQLIELKEICKNRTWKNVEVFEDQISGAKFTRTGLDKMMGKIRQGKIERVVVVKLDRLGRSLPHLAQLIGEFDLHRVALVATSQGIDTSQDNPAGRLQMHVLMAVAEFERSLIRERTKAGMVAAKERGSRIGRPATAGQHREAVLALAGEGIGARLIAQRLGLPLSTVSRLLAEEKKGNEGQG